MATITRDNQRQIADIADRHGVSVAAAGALRHAIVAGGGRQAQFNHPELGGLGQWSQGGMIMIGDMFNTGLKVRVAVLCDDLARTLHDNAAWARKPDEHASVGVSAWSGRWQAELGPPSSSGSQNAMHYAVFSETQRLAIERDGHVTIYDTGDHRIGGVSQQSGGQPLRFTSQLGAVHLADLRVISR